MFKKIITTFVLILPIFSTTGYTEIENYKDLSYYLRIDGGVSWARDINYSSIGRKYSIKDNYLVDIGIGKYITDHLRADLVLSTRQYKINSFSMQGSSAIQGTQQIRSTILMLNGYYDIIKNSRITPYLFAGAGFAFNKAGTLSNYTNGTLSSTYNKYNNNSFAWQIGAGITTKLPHKFALDVEYKFVNMGIIKTGNGTSFSVGSVSPGLMPIPGTLTASSTNPTKGRLTANEVTIGIRYNF
jgi:opacity protein-like surface antigen